MWRNRWRVLGQVYYINRLEDLVSLVVDVTGRAYAGESFISSAVDCKSWRAGIG